MKKISTAVLALFIVISLGDCVTEAPVKRVKKCAKVVDVKLFQSYFLGIIESRLDPNPYKILDNGKRVRIYDNGYYERDGSEKLLETMRRMEIGSDYCWIEYEKVK